MRALNIFLETIRKAVFSHDSFMIFAIASLFYLVFYALPYDNQIIVKIPTAIVDMDQSRLSQDLTNKIQSTSVVETVLKTSDFTAAQNAFRRSEVDVMIVIGESFSEDIGRGEKTVITVFSNGALPVKGRAVSASLLSIVAEENIVQSASRLVSQGLNPILVKQMSMQPSTFSSQDLFNNISGYGYYTVPMVAIVIVQAVLLFGVGIALGGWLSAENAPDFFNTAMQSPAAFTPVFLGFWFIAFFWACFIEGFGLSILSMPTLANPLATLIAIVAFTLSLTALAVFMALWMNTNRYAAGLVLASAPSVFLSGLVFPMENFASWVLPFAWMIPTTPGCQAIVLASQEGALLSDIASLVLINLIQATVYGMLGYRMLLKRINERKNISLTSASDY